MAVKLKHIVESFENKKMSDQEKMEYLNEISNFNQFGSTIYRTEDLKRVGQAVTEIADKAERLALTETEDWFDEVTLKRNMKTIKEGAKQFNKTIQEISKLQQRLESLYEEIGHNLGRYYEIK